MKPIKTKIISIKNHVWNYRARYAAGATVVGMTYAGFKLNETRTKHLNEFLEEHGLTEEYYLAEEDRIES